MKQPLSIYDCANLDATLALAAEVARSLRAGDVIALDGPMGAGKTTFVRGLAAALGINPAIVSSPTFVVVNNYPVPRAAAGPLAGGTLIHVDAYRLSGADDLDSLGWERLFNEDGSARGRAAAVIEWPGRVEDAMPRGKRLVRVTMTPVGRDARRVEIAKY
ncbi:MAG: tRNA (adenosine(37)-N6)-threonylcarbamoyltransferase complex ATPase subunit type 1 TsaE [Phycisphaerales bacterium]|jgi:tRNA threonylcarbamoyladenosine biosynthesis protein TsaE